MSILHTHDFHISIGFFVPFCSISLILCFPIFFSLLFLNSFFFSIDYIQIDVTRNHYNPFIISYTRKEKGTPELTQDVATCSLYYHVQCTYILHNIDGINIFLLNLISLILMTRRLDDNVMQLAYLIIYIKARKYRGVSKISLSLSLSLSPFLSGGDGKGNLTSPFFHF